MSNSILVPHDGSADGQAALEYALETFPDARLVLFYAIDPFEVTSDEDRLPALSDAWLEDQREEAAALFDDALEDTETGAVTIETETRVGSPPEAIVAAAEDLAVDQVVLGSRGRGQITDARMGSTAELVVKRADVPVTVVR
ncbi:universal stress protein [Natrarchaeobaculum sulfurireducens]|uniref:Nucleotide-binding protein, UspA family n=1 Tax=Natrarchaeobaculum sulfurireducens TaxID=2044521 RepID=A0A346PSY1_9EURY|nr:universal stress protein [Natrarchaeobaculum sulfurireducens]AXR77409.1 Nucleotide-binding protein, UspA family [Natrarchaeobaculum sulfurireducens]AXR82626.1 Universal stress protein [Natrarchaeobaculum sulfurireducens]